MEVLIFSQGMDTGGQGVRIAQAFRRHAPDWTVRAMHKTQTFIRYPADEAWNLDRARELYDRADVVHHKNGLGLYAMFDGDQRKPTIMHHQGTRLRRDADAVTREGESIGAVQLASTVDLLKDCPPAEWLPTPYDLEGLAERYRRRPVAGKITIGHAPTDRRAKNTDAIMKAVGRVQERFAHVDFDLIEMVEWRVCISRKARCDIVVDQITNGYGNNTVEAWALGIPVVSGWGEDPTDRDRFIDATGFEPPFMEATNVDELETALTALVASADLRDEYGRMGRDFARAFHSELAVVQRLQRIYSEAPATRGVAYLEETKDSVRKRGMVTA